MIALLIDFKWYLIIVLIGISPVISDIEYLLLSLLNTCISSLEICLFESFELDLLLLSCRSLVLYSEY